jgi:hypothetical protein
MVIYATRDLAGCLDHMDSPAARAAIADGESRENQYPLLDGEPFTANIYLPDQVFGSLDEAFVAGDWFYAERFEVPYSHDEEFVPWIEGYGARLTEWPGVTRVRTWTQYRDAPPGFPFDRYRSKGNRMVSVEVAAEVAVEQIVGHPLFGSDLADSLSRWDAVLPYVRRDLGKNLLVRP